MKPNPIFYRADDPGAIFAAKRDADFFAKNPRAVWRVRPLIEGESPLVDQMRRTGMRAYAVVIYHARAGDKRASAGHGIYPVMLAEQDRTRALRLLRDEARRMVRWFRKCSSTPPPARPGHMVAM